MFGNKTNLTENRAMSGDSDQNATASELLEQTNALQSESRRRFLGVTAATPMLYGLFSGATLFGGSRRAQADTGAAGANNMLGKVLMPQSPAARQRKAFLTRFNAALRNYERPLPNHRNNGDESNMEPLGLGNFHKSLPHNLLGEVDQGAYFALLDAIRRGTDAAYDTIPLGGERRLVNPQAGLAFDLEGPDAAATFIPPAPAFKSAWRVGEMVEHYWQALLRDVPFDEYATHPLAQQAIDDLNRLSDFRGPKQNGLVTAQTLFRDPVPGATVGPYISQFFLKPINFGAQTIDPRVRPGLSGKDYMTGYDAWLDVQNGIDTPPLTVVSPQDARFINDGRALSQFVHIDALYQAYFNALLVCLGSGMIWDSGNPYGPTPEGGAGRPLPAGAPGAPTRVAFATFGGPYILALLTEVSTRVLKAQWFQKWNVHRTLRPEAFGGIVHNVLSNAADYPVHPDALNSSAVAKIFEKYGSYLLPQAFPEGSPNHPSYGSGHACVAGACVTILKAFLEEDSLIPNPVVVSPDGSRTDPYVGPDLTVGGELNKLASNVATGRNIAGIHWRSDANESLKLGEAVAIGVLRDQRQLYAENFGGYTFTKFDGTTITV